MWCIYFYFVSNKSNISILIAGPTTKSTRQMIAVIVSVTMKLLDSGRHGDLTMNNLPAGTALAAKNSLSIREREGVVDSSCLAPNVVKP